MLWNWYTVDACFISSTWRVTSAGMFAGSCIGVICLVILLEFLRRVQREYDQLIQRSRSRRATSLDMKQNASKPVESTNGDALAKGHASSSAMNTSSDSDGSIHSSPPAANPFNSSFLLGLTASQSGHSRQAPTIVQQIIRSAIYMCQFAVAYFVMLLAMYYNGYVLICIFIGAFLGSFIWSWDLGSGSSGTG